MQPGMRRPVREWDITLSAAQKPGLSRGLVGGVIARADSVRWSSRVPRARPLRSPGTRRSRVGDEAERAKRGAQRAYARRASCRAIEAETERRNQPRKAEAEAESR